jgi:hypothetical protein
MRASGHEWARVMMPVFVVMIDRYGRGVDSIWVRIAPRLNGSSR